MKSTFLAGAACALAFCTPNFASATDAVPSVTAMARDSRQFTAGALHVEQRGSGGAPLIFIPGLASGSWTWAAEADRLSRDHTVYLITLPGFDGRPVAQGATLQSLREDLRQLIEARRLYKPVLIGHSLGGVMALDFAIRHGGLLAGVIAVDGLPVLPGTESIQGDRGALALGARQQMQSQTPAQFAAYEQAYMRQTGVLDAELADRLAALAARSDVQAVAHFAAQLIELDLRSGLASIAVPVVEIAPFHAPDMARIGIDEAGKVAYYRQLLAGVAQLDVIPVSQARHFAMFDQPEAFSRALDRALQRMLPQGSRP